MNDDLTKLTTEQLLIAFRRLPRLPGGISGPGMQEIERHLAEARRRDELAANGGWESDWSRLEDWAQHYTRDANGRAMQWETKPYFDGGMGIWMNEDDSLRAVAAMPPLIRNRPTTDGTGA